jgi:hypothetical protein
MFRVFQVIGFVEWHQQIDAAFETEQILWDWGFCGSKGLICSTLGYDSVEFWWGEPMLADEENDQIVE